MKMLYAKLLTGEIMLRVGSFNIILLGLFSIPIFATSFIATPIDNQIAHSDGVVVGIFEGESYKKNQHNEVVTEAYFKIIKQVGIANNRLLNPYSFRVLIPGGRWQGSVYNISGTPKFKKGEKVVLLLKHHSFGFSLTNLSMSKFKIVNKDRKIYLVSDIFSNHQNVGIIEWKKFETVVKRHFGSGLISSEGRKFFISKKTKSKNKFYKNNKTKNYSNNEESFISQGRKFASVPKEKQSNGMLWFIIILSALGGASVGIARYKRD